MVVVERERPTRDKSVMCENGAHGRPKSSYMMFLPTGNVSLSAMVVGANQGTSISTPTGAELAVILSYRHRSLNKSMSKTSRRYHIKQLSFDQAVRNPNLVG